MQIIETSSEGLKRELRVVVGAGEIGARFAARLDEIKDRVQLKGFRKGKVPVAHLKRLFGRSLMGEVLQATIEEKSRAALSERKERPALVPEIKLSEDSTEIERVMAGEADLAFAMSFEVLPEIALADLGGLRLERLVADVEEEAVDTALGALRERNTRFRPVEGRAAETGDKVTVDFTGTIGGEPFEGGSGQDISVVLGHGHFIPGFEDGLAGAKAGEKRPVSATFPAEYPQQTLAGKTAEFEVTVKEVAVPEQPALDDEFAKTLGAQDLAHLRQLVREQIERDYAAASRTKVKRALLDDLERLHAFDLPGSLVEREFGAIWEQVAPSLERRPPVAGEATSEQAAAEGAESGAKAAPGSEQGPSAAPQDGEQAQRTEAARAEYRRIAARRVRLGLVLGEIGERNKIEVTQDELRRALVEEARRYPGQERAVYEFYEKNPGAVAQLRAPIYEEKVVDFILELAKPTERKVTREELFAPEPDEA